MNLKPIILDEILERHKQKIKEEIIKESVAPTEHLKLYDKYQDLITKQADRDIDQFLAEEHTFQEKTAEVARYQNLRDEIQFTSRKVTYICIYGVVNISACIALQLEWHYKFISSLAIF